MTTATKPDFVYVTYIATTAEKVWQALTETDITREYWADPGSDKPAHVNVSDWMPGSVWEHQVADASKKVDVIGRVVESQRPHRLVISWARPNELADTEKHSRVTFEIDALNDHLVRLTVKHEDLAKDEKMFNGVSAGWPMVLSNLKTFLETKRSLRASA